MRVQNLFLVELKGHLATVVIATAAMTFAGFLSSFLEAASYQAANVSEEALPGLIPSFLLVCLALLPAVFVSLGMYAIVDASEEEFRYEVGVYASQGIDGYTIVDTLSSLYGWIPLMGYALGICVYFGAVPGAFDALQAVLADIIAGLILVAGLPGFILIPRRLNAILETSPYVVVRS